MSAHSADEGEDLEAGEESSLLMTTRESSDDGNGVHSGTTGSEGEEQEENGSGQAGGRSSIAALSPAQAPERGVECRPVHVVQRYNWDCGVTCAEMILRGFDVPGGDDYGAIHSIVGTSSPWTVDVAQIFMSFNVPFTYTTLEAGVNDEYGKMSFYSGSMDSDKVRVMKRFADLRDQGMVVDVRSVSEDELLSWLTNGCGVAIVLIDRRLLKCQKCSKVDVANLASCCLTYLGHYIVVYDWDPLARTVLYRDPARRRARSCTVTLADFDAARRAYGTDEDILFVPYPGLPPMHELGVVGQDIV